MQGPTVLAVGAGGGCLDIFSLIYHFFSFSLSLSETARYRLKYCLKGPLSPNQPTNQPRIFNTGSFQLKLLELTPQMLPKKLKLTLKIQSFHFYGYD